MFKICSVLLSVLCLSACEGGPAKPFGSNVLAICSTPYALVETPKYALDRREGHLFVKIYMPDGRLGGWVSADKCVFSPYTITEGSSEEEPEGRRAGND